PFSSSPTLSISPHHGWLVHHGTLSLTKQQLSPSSETSTTEPETTFSTHRERFSGFLESISVGLFIASSFSPGNEPQTLPW
ncbi:hypothetical protein CHARACLAT_012300, partial [Characodon lateralis]|nr:hypothetical protein [Characodon lateralis]